MIRYTESNIVLQKVADGFLQRVGWINREALNKERKIAYDVLKNILETFIAGYKWKEYVHRNFVTLNNQ